MAVAKTVTSKEMAMKKFKPELNSVDKKDLSGYFPKDEIFNKKKTYLIKGKPGEHSLDADWRNLHIGGRSVVLHKGVELSNTDANLFDKEAKAFYLNKKTSSTKLPKVEKEIVSEEADV